MCSLVIYVRQHLLSSQMILKITCRTYHSFDKESRALRWIRRPEKDARPLKYDDVIRSRLRITSDSFVSRFQPQLQEYRIRSVIFPHPILRGDDRCRAFFFLFSSRSAYPSQPRIAARVLRPSFYHYSARSNRWSNPDFLLIAARGTRACKTLSPSVEHSLSRRTLSHVVSMEMKRHRRYTEIISPSSIVVPRAANNFSTSLYHSP